MVWFITSVLSIRCLVAGVKPCRRVRQAGGERATRERTVDTAVIACLPLLGRKAPGRHELAGNAKGMVG